MVRRSVINVFYIYYSLSDLCVGLTTIAEYINKLMQDLFSLQINTQEQFNLEQAYRIYVLRDTLISIGLFKKI